MASNAFFRRPAIQLLAKASASYGGLSSSNNRSCSLVRFTISGILQRSQSKQSCDCFNLMSRRWNSSDVSNTKQDTGSTQTTTTTAADSSGAPPLIDEALLKKYTKEVPILMPDIGAGNGRILVWYKQEGEVVQPDDLLCEIATDNFAFDMTMTDEEYPFLLKQILMPADSPKELPPNTPICISLHEVRGKAAEEAAASTEAAAAINDDEDSEEEAYCDAEEEAAELEAAGTAGDTQTKVEHT